MPDEPGGGHEKPKHPRKISQEDYERLTIKDEILQSVADTFREDIESAQKKYHSREFSLFLDLKNEYTDEDALVIQHLIDRNITIVPDTASEERKEPMKHYKLNSYYRGNHGSLARIRKIDKKTSQISIEREGSEEVLKEAEFNAEYRQLLLYKGQVFLKPKGKGKRERMVVPRDVFVDENITGERLVCEFEGKPGGSKDYSIETIVTNKLPGDKEQSIEGKEPEEKKEGKAEAHESGKENGFSPLEQRVEELRREFVEHDLEHAGMWQKLKRVFSKLEGDHTKTSEYQEKREAYTEALKLLQEERFKKLQSEVRGKNEAEKWQIIEGHLRYFNIDERIRLYDTATEAKKDREDQGSFWNRAKERMKGMVDGYRSLSWKQKLAISGMLAGATFLTAGTGGGAALAVAGAAAFKRSLGAAILFTTAEAMGNKVFDKKDRKKAEQELQKNIEHVLVEEILRRTKSGGGVENRYGALRDLLNQEIENIDQSFQKKKKRVARVKMGSFVAAIGLVSPAVTHAAETWFGGGHSVAVPGGAPAAAVTPEQIPDVNHAVEANAALPSSEAQSLGGAANLHTVGEHSIITESEAPETGSITGTFSGFPETPISVTEADSARGLWGILDRQLPASLTGVDRVRAIASMQNAIHNHLAGMSDTDIHQQFGFRSHDINVVHPGDKLNLHELIPQDQMESILQGHDVVLAPDAHVALDGVHAEVPDPGISVPDHAIVHTADAPHTPDEALIHHEAAFSHSAPLDSVVHPAPPASLPVQNTELFQHADMHTDDLDTPTDVHTDTLAYDHSAEVPNATEYPFVGIGSMKDFLSEHPELKPEIVSHHTALVNDITTVSTYPQPVTNFTRARVMGMLGDQKVGFIANESRRWGYIGRDWPNQGRLRYLLYPRLSDGPSVIARDEYNLYIRGVAKNIRNLVFQSEEKYGSAAVFLPDERVDHYLDRLAVLETLEEGK